MQPEDVVNKTKTLSIVFDPGATSRLPVLHANAINVAVLAAEFYITFGAVMPPEVKSIEELQNIDQLVAQPQVRIAVTPQAMRQFLDVMQQQFDQFLTQAQSQLDQVRDKEGNSNE